MSETRLQNDTTTQQGEIMPALLAGHTILTPDARAAEIIRERYALHMHRSQLTGWTSPSVLPWRVWAANFYTLAMPDGPVLLSNEQALLIWEQIVSAEDDISLEQVSQFTRLAAEAWATQHLWGITLGSQSKNHNSYEVGLFAKWQREFEVRCRDLQVVDCYQSLNRLRAAFEQQAQADADHAFGAHYLDAERLLVGYPKVPPLLQHLSPHCWSIPAAANERGENTRPVENTPRKKTQLLSFDDETDEIVSAIDWAVSLSLDEPDKTVAIALSNPSMLADSVGQGIARYCVAELDGQGTIKQQMARQIVTPKQRPLTKDKLIQSALRVLRFSGPLESDELSALLLDPYLGDWRTQRAGRALLDRDLRADIRELRITETFVLTQMRREQYGLEAFADQLQALGELRDSAPHRQSIIAWQEHFESQLGLFSWPKQTFILESEQATFDAWRGVLDTFVSLSSYAGPCTRSHALHRLTSIIQNRSVDHQSAKQKSLTAIRVVSTDEIPLLDPQAVAWCGLGQYQWPAVTQINPLLPHRSQRAAGVPGADVGEDAALARTHLLASIESVAENRFSYTARLGDIENLPLAFLEATDGHEQPQDEAPMTESAFHFPVESTEDIRGLALDATGRLRSAVRFFADQAACPFKAYAAHRLGSETIEEPALGLDARRRGELVHLAVAKLWGTLLTHETLLAMSDEAVSELVERSVQESIADYRQTTRQLSHYWVLEAARLHKLLLEWLAVERKREPFEVMGIEESFEASVAEFRFNIRLDRIDKLPDGELAVIDFKTSADTKSSWAPPRIDQPQLPIYAVNFENDLVGAVAYAQIKSGQCDIKDLPPKALTKGQRDDAWEEQMRQWRYDLNLTAAQIAGGEASVDPKKSTTCRYCEHRLLCRISDTRDLPSTEQEQMGHGLTINDGLGDE